MARWLASRTFVIPVTLGMTDLTAVQNQVERLLHRRRNRVIVDVVAFEYFDERMLAALSAIVASDKRITLRGLDRYATALLDAEPAPVVDVRSVAERLVSHLEVVTVVTASWQGQSMDDPLWDEALSVAFAGGRRLVTVDLRDVQALSAHQLLSLAEFSADLIRIERTLVVVNVTPHVDTQLRTCGLHGELLIGADSPR